MSVRCGFDRVVVVIFAVLLTACSPQRPSSLDMSAIATASLTPQIGAGFHEFKPEVTVPADPMSLPKIPIAPAPTVAPTAETTLVPTEVPLPTETSAPTETPTVAIPSTQVGSNNTGIIQTFLTDPSIILSQIDAAEFYSETAGGQLLDPSFITTEINTPPGLPVELNVIVVTPILLDVFIDEAKTYMTLGALDARGQPFVYITTTGFLDQNTYPTYGVTRSFARGNTNGSPPLNFSTQGRNVSIRFSEIPNSELKDYLITEIGMPIKVILNGITFTDGKTSGSVAGMSLAEEGQLRLLTAPSMLNQLVARYNGGNLDANFVINDESQIANIVNVDIVPLVSQLEPILD